MTAVVDPTNASTVVPGSGVAQVTPEIDIEIDLPARPEPEPQPEPSFTLSLATGGKHRQSATSIVERHAKPQVVVAAWLVASLLGMALVIYGFGPVFQQRDQDRLLGQFRGEINRAANEATGLEGVTIPTKAPAIGAPVAILEVGPVKLQQGVVEGASASQTRVGPGHVPGTAGIGQPGNSVVVGRRTAFGGSFSALDDLVRGDKVLVTTLQGQSVYEVMSVKDRKLTKAATEKLYGPSEKSQLTLVTSSSVVPFNSKSATVVIAQLKGTPFAPTPQGGRSDSQSGTGGDQGAVASVVLALAAYAAVMVGGVVLYRRLRPRTAYLLTIAPVVALTIITAETVSRIFPAWM